jgi:hypothetical protein
MATAEARSRVRENYTASQNLWWSYQEAAEYSGLMLSTLYVYAHEKRFRTRAKGILKIDRVSFERYLLGT